MNHSPLITYRLNPQPHRLNLDAPAPNRVLLLLKKYSSKQKRNEAPNKERVHYLHISLHLNKVH